jgi:hypothetical protein
MDEFGKEIAQFSIDIIRCVYSPADVSDFAKQSGSPVIIAGNNLALFGR